MTALRIFKTATPSLIGAPVQPMSKADAEFWELRRNRAGTPVSHSPAARKAGRGVTR